MFPLSLTLPGKGEFKKIIGKDKTYSGRPVYNHTETGELIFFRGEFWVLMIERGSGNFVENCWQLCTGCDYKATGSVIGAVKSLSPSLMIPRLTFQEWEGLESTAGSNLLRET